jgi:TolB protein
MRHILSNTLKIFLWLEVLCMAGCSSEGTITLSPMFTPTSVPIPTVTAPLTLASFTGKIAFMSGDNHILVMNADGSELVDVTPPELSRIEALSWSPDGKHIAFNAWKDDSWRIFKIKSDGSDLVLLTPGDAGGVMPSWSPDGENILFASSDQNILDDSGSPAVQIYIMNADGTGRRRFIVKTKPDNTYMTGSYRMDGLIAISERITRYADTNYIVNSEGVIQKQYPEFSTDLPVAWSPDGGFVAYFRGGRVPGCFGIVVMKFDKSEQHCLLDQKLGSGVYFSQISWSPDGKYILFTSNLKGKYDIYVIRPDGSGLTQLTDMPGSPWGAVWWSAP